MSAKSIANVLLSIAFLAVGLILFLPALGRVRYIGPTALTPRAELSGLQMALVAFKAKYGRFPPTRLVLRERFRQVANPVDPLTESEFDRSLQELRAFWPKFGVTADGAGFDTDCDGIADADWLDMNGNGVIDDGLILDEGETLVFFLGGIVRAGCCIGHARSECNPFADKRPRDGPFFEFENSRLEDRDGDGFYSYYFRKTDAEPFKLVTQPDGKITVQGFAP